MNALLISALLVLIGPGSEDYEWHDGSIVTSSGQVLVGKFAIVYDYETILFKKKRGHKVIPAFKITSFRYFDSEKNINRKFIVVARKKRQKLHHEFFEIVSQGEIEVVRRRYKRYQLLQEPKTEDLMFSSKEDKEMYEEVTGHDYYTIWKNELVPIVHFQYKLLPEIIDQHEGKLQEFIEISELDLTRLGDCVRVVSFYNDLEKARQNGLSFRQLN